MGRQSGKNTLNIIKSDKPQETSGSTTAKLNEYNTDEARENDFKNKFMKIIEILKK